MGVYKFGIVVCHIVLAIVCIVDIIFRFHGLLVLPVCILTSMITLFLTSKLTKAKQKMLNDSGLNKGLLKPEEESYSEFENEVSDDELNEED